MASTLTILICTHNRADLLARTLRYLNEAQRPQHCSVEIFVVANACTDGTHDLIAGYPNHSHGRFGSGQALPLRWIAEPVPGKSHALNRAIPLVTSELVAFVDDDHRVDVDYLRSVAHASVTYRDMDIFCGRILPDWDGREPGWVHDTGSYRVYPLPVPHYQQGDVPKEITVEGPAPGGGNLCVRRPVFDRVGSFSVELGPHGHDLGGGEDSDFVYRCLDAGMRIQYVPDIVQFHYVDLKRLQLRYLLRKSFQRSRSGIRTKLSDRRTVPLYMWRKLVAYMLFAVASWSWARTRFYAVRTAAALGEIRGFMDNAAARTTSGPINASDARKH